MNISSKVLIFRLHNECLQIKKKKHIFNVQKIRMCISQKRITKQQGQKVLNLTTHHGNVNQNPSEIPSLPPDRTGYSKHRWQIGASRRLILLGRMQ
jgi:hypothetical protein